MARGDGVVLRAPSVLIGAHRVEGGGAQQDGGAVVAVSGVVPAGLRTALLRAAGTSRSGAPGTRSIGFRPGCLALAVCRGP